MKLAVAVYYFLIGVIKGVARVGMQVVIMIYYFFYPHIALLPAGFEALDAAHTAFVSAVMTAVELDQRRCRAATKVVDVVDQKSITVVQLSGPI